MTWDELLRLDQDSGVHRDYAYDSDDFDPRCKVHGDPLQPWCGSCLTEAAEAEALIRGET